MFEFVKYKIVYNWIYNKIWIIYNTSYIIYMIYNYSNCVYIWLYIYAHTHTQFEFEQVTRHNLKMLGRI